MSRRRRMASRNARPAPLRSPAYRFGGFTGFLDRLMMHGLEYFQLYYGVYRAVVVSNEDPENEGQPDPHGRLIIRVPALGDNEEVRRLSWPMSPIAGPNYGFKSLPPADGHVYVMFERGSPNTPLWIGGWWAADQIPSDLNKTETHWWITPGNHQIVMDEQEGEQVIRIKHLDGSTRVELDNDGNIFIVNKGGSKVHVGDGADTLNPTQPAVLGEKLKGLLEELIDAINALTVPTPAGASSTPVNAPVFSAIKARLETMLSQTVDLK